jgi:hypothetical protein
MKYILISILFLTSLSVFSQGTMATNNASNQNIGATNSTASAKSKKSHELPESLVNFDVHGETYSLLAGYPGSGIKMVVGSKNTGFLVGFSFGGDDFSETYRSIRVGYQYGIKRGFYANANLNVMNFNYNRYNSYIPNDRSLRLNLGIGYTFSFGKRKRVYYNFETGFAVINTQDLISRLCINSGLGFRIGTPAKTSYEGVKNVTTVPMK